MKVLMVGSLHIGFRIYGPIQDADCEDDPAAIEEACITALDESFEWFELEPVPPERET
jgi:hypothetical protein